MKNMISILSALLISSSFAFASTVVNGATQSKHISKSKELSWVDEQIKAILPARKGVSNSYIDGIHPSFIFVVVKSVTVNGQPKTNSSRFFKRSWKPSLKVTLIINSKAFINKRWYGINDKVQGYKIKSIGDSKVVLVKNGKTKTLSMKKDNKNIQINTK